MRLLGTAGRLGGIYRDYRGRQERPGVLPIRLWIETSAVCNLRCVMCPNKSLGQGGKGLMRMDLFRRLIDEARGFAHDIYLHHRGEPLLNPALFDMIAYARAAGLKTRLHSNGTLLDAGKADAMLEARPDLLSFSVDGFSRSAYESIRVGASFEATTGNILRFLEKRRTRGQQRPYTVVERIRFRTPPADETPEGIRAWTQRFLAAGLDEVIVKEEYTWAEPGAAAAAAPVPSARCTFPWYAMVICWNGVVTPCPQDFQAALRMGDASQASLREIWNSPAYRDLRRRLNSDVGSLPLCRACDRLQRKTVGGVPWQYMMTFLVDHLVGYNRLRRWLGTFERN